MSRNQRKWTGNLISLPLDPDLILSRHVQWSRDFSQKFSTLDGPEPDNLTCASAWIGRIPDNAIAREAFIYKDKNTKLWIQAVPWRVITLNEAQSWTDLQRSMGAVSVWFNYNAKPHRRRKTYAERELLKINSEEITYVDLLHEAGLLKFGDTDFSTLVTNAQPRSIDVDILRELDEGRPPSKKKYAKLAPGQQQRLATKPVRTDLGIFASVTAAAAAHGYLIAKMSNLVNSNDPRYEFISREDYDKLITDVNKQDNKMLS